MRALRRLVVVVVVLAALLVAIDRGAAFAASRLAARAAEHNGAQSANVRILGFPFLTQVLRGKLGEVTVSERDITGNGITVDSLYATGRDIHLPLADIVRGRVSGIPVGAVDGTAVISYATLTASIVKAFGLGANFTLSLTPAGTGDVVAHVHGLGVTVNQTVPVPTVVAGRLQLGAFVTRFASFLPSSVSRDLSVAVPTLPYGLVLGAATAQADGLHLVVTGRNVTLPAPS